jgi:hypothetical protein
MLQQQHHHQLTDDVLTHLRSFFPFYSHHSANTNMFEESGDDDESWETDEYSDDCDEEAGTSSFADYGETSHLSLSLSLSGPSFFVPPAPVWRMSGSAGGVAFSAGLEDNIGAD